MDYASKDQLLAASDMREEDLYLPSIGMTVRVRSLSAAYSNQAVTEASTIENVRGEAVARFSASRLEELKVVRGLVAPQLETVEEARQLSKRWGSAWKDLVNKIDELSGTSEQDARDLDTLFRTGRTTATGADGVNGTAAGGDRPDQHVRAGSGAGDASG